MSQLPTVSPSQPYSSLHSFAAANRIVRWFVPLGALLTLAAYWGPWVGHFTAGLTVTGVDMAEFVKFLPGVRGQSVQIWREAFYLPSWSASLALSLVAYRAELVYPYWLRLALILTAITAALTVLPPAWTPGLLFTEEFRVQTIGMLLALVLAALSPVIALIPRRLVTVLLTALTLPALVLPLWTLRTAWPEISSSYGFPIQPGWGPFVLVPALLLIVVGGLVLPSAPSKSLNNQTRR